MPNKIYCRLFLAGFVAVFCGSAAFAQTAPTIVSKDAAETLVYRNPAQPVTIGEMSAAQRKQLEKDYFKRAGFTTTPIAVLPKTKASAARAAIKPKAIVFVQAIYGPINAQKVELSVNGRTSVLSSGATLGPVLIENLKAGEVVLVNVNPSNGAGQVKRTLKAGDVWEIQL